MQKNFKLGLIGYPLSHSFSPGYFAQKFSELGIEDSEYLAYPIDNIGKVKDIFSSRVDGLNVTIPYKEQVLPFLDELSDEAYNIGAVNTIKKVGDRWIGYNTDVYGFKQSLLKQLDGETVKKALILGSGGASKAVKFVLSNLGIEYKIVSRKPQEDRKSVSRIISYSDVTSDVLSEHKLIVNTTPLGMYPKIDKCPDLPYEGLGEKHFLYDLVYNPEKTLFLTKGEQAGCSIKNGFDMLILQAEKSWQIWNQQ